MSYLDTHAHLDAAEFDADRDQVIARAEEAGIEAILCPGITAESSRAAVRLAQTNEVVFAAVGIQPNYAAGAAADDWDRVVELAKHPRVIAVGETGLDRHWDFTPMEVQREFFDRHLRLAQENGLPLVIHCREAEADLLPMLREAATRGPLGGVLHAFGSEAPLAEACLDLGLYVSFAGAVTYKNRKFDPLRAVAAQVPDDRLLIETDSPYLVPHPLRGRQKRNEPAHVVHTARCLAELRGQGVEELAAQTTANARRLFRLP
ncbi:MAG: TatD family hydrolase [Planctomycetota bacterium]